MYLLLLLFCATTAAFPEIPPIDGVDQSGIFNYMRLEFESRRLFVNIVDTVSSFTAPASSLNSRTRPTALAAPEDKDVLPTAVSIGVRPSERQPDHYGFVMRKIAETLRCVDASDAEFEQESGEPEYVLMIDNSNAQAIKRDVDTSEDGKSLLRRVAVHAGMTKEEASKMELTDCWFMRAPEVMQINVAVSRGPNIRSGWIVERYPLGKFHKKPDQLSYRYPIYLTNYSYIDGTNGAIVDVQESRDEDGKRVWTPTGWPAFARVGMEMIPIDDAADYTLFRETEAGVLITTRSQSMRVSYNIDEESIEERLQLDGNHYHISCNRKEGSRTQSILVSQDAAFVLVPTNDGVEIELQATGRIDRFKCFPKRETHSGTPELLQLDFIEQSGSRPIPWSDREITVRRINAVKEETTTRGEAWTTAAILPDGIEEFEEREGAQDDWLDQDIMDKLLEWKEQRKEEEDLILVGSVMLKPTSPPAEMQEVLVEDEDQKFLTQLALMVLAVVLLALGCVICVGACIRERVRRSRDPLLREWVKDRNDGRRKEGSTELKEQSRIKLEAINKKNEEKETEDRKLSSSSTPMRSNSGRKITFAPKPSGMKTDELVKMITEEEIGSKIDAMVEAGPDGEEEYRAMVKAGPDGEDDEEKKMQLQQVQQNEGAAVTPVAAAAPIAARREGVEEEEDAPLAIAPAAAAAAAAPIPAARAHGAPLARAEVAVDVVDDFEVVDETSKKPTSEKTAE